MYILRFVSGKLGSNEETDGQMLMHLLSLILTSACIVVKIKIHLMTNYVQTYRHQKEGTLKLTYLNGLEM